MLDRVELALVIRDGPYLVAFVQEWADFITGSVYSIPGVRAETASVATLSVASSHLRWHCQLLIALLQLLE